MPVDDDVASGFDEHYSRAAIGNVGRIFIARGAALLVSASWDVIGQTCSQCSQCVPRLWEQLIQNN